MTTLQTLEIKSHSDELRKEVDAYFEKYPRLPEEPSQESQVEKDLREELEYLARILNK